MVWSIISKIHIKIISCLSDLVPKLVLHLVWRSMDPFPPPTAPAAEELLTILLFQAPCCNCKENNPHSQFFIESQLFTDGNYGYRIHSVVVIICCSFFIVIVRYIEWSHPHSSPEVGSCWCRLVRRKPYENCVWWRIWGVESEVQLPCRPVYIFWVPRRKETGSIVDGGNHPFHLSYVDVNLVFVKFRTYCKWAGVLSDHIVAVSAIHKVSSSRAETSVVIQIGIKKNICALPCSVVLWAYRVASL